MTLRQVLPDRTPTFGVICDVDWVGVSVTQNQRSDVNDVSHVTSSKLHQSVQILTSLTTRATLDKKDPSIF